MDKLRFKRSGSGAVLGDNEARPESADVAAAAVAPEAGHDEMEARGNLQVGGDTDASALADVLVARGEGHSLRRQNCDRREQAGGLKVPVTLQPLRVPGELGDDVGVKRGRRSAAAAGAARGVGVGLRCAEKRGEGCGAARVLLRVLG